MVSSCWHVYVRFRPKSLYAYALAADFTTRSDTDSWTRDDLKDEHDDLDDAKALALV